MKKSNKSLFDELPPHLSESGYALKSEIAYIKQWLDDVFHDFPPGKNIDRWHGRWIGTSLPFSFKHGGKIWSEINSKWSIKTTKNANDDGTSDIRVVWEEKESGFRVIWGIKCFSHLPAVEWLITFENAGISDSALLTDIKVADIKIRNSDTGKPYNLHSAYGGRSKRDDFMPVSWELPSEGNQADRITLGGTTQSLRSSENNLPFFNIETSDRRGIMIGVGWSGTWISHVGVDDDCLYCDAGIDNAGFILHPGENVRMPRILMVVWEGERLHGHNMLRKLLYEHYVPGIGDDRQTPMVTVNHGFTHHYWSRKYKKISTDNCPFLYPRELNVVPLIEPFGKIGVELMNIDIGWTPVYEAGIGVGDWRYDPVKFPSGLSPIAESMNRNGIKFGIWFQCEKVDMNTPLAREHPEWLGFHREANRFTLRLEIPQAREWFLNQVDELIRNQGMQCYRQDGWGAFGNNEADDRKCISQIFHLTGLYALWDELKRRYPGLLMEGCSGGGRRVDLETLSRFSWHQKADYWFDTESDQCGLYGANMYLPGGLLIIPVESMDNYSVWSGFAGQLNLAWHPLDDAFPMEMAQYHVELYKRIRNLLCGDFYPLTPCSLDSEWIGYQFSRYDLGKGVALIFRRPFGSENPDCTDNNPLKIILRGIDPVSNYNVRFENIDHEVILRGADLSTGIDVIIEEAPGAEMMIYQKI